MEINEENRIKILNEEVFVLDINPRITSTFKIYNDIPKNIIDVILLDPPCTSTGVIRRHPDILHRVNIKNLEY